MRALYEIQKIERNVCDIAETGRSNWTDSIHTGYVAIETIAYIYFLVGNETLYDTWATKCTCIELPPRAFPAHFETTGCLLLL